MKSINVYFENDEFDFLKKIKKKMSWRELILKLAKGDKDGNK
ncbi:hypothetical protein LCGC14_2617010 [marine sediment metagenome]|uniref:Uncharacterized protein n=1 Tax=marine sediment metagenome TaxID=412755 RepID=A0A0F9A447_9ZZZZ